MQIGELSHLAHLGLMACRYTGFPALARLSASLRRLSLVGCTTVPECLAELTGLEALMIGDHHNEGELAENAGEVLTLQLPRLANLTSLAISSMPGMDGPPQEMAALSKLRRFAWVGDLPSEATLPAGPWLEGLKQLAAPPALLANSWQQLAVASQLQDMVLTPTWTLDEESFTDPDPALIQLFTWASKAPSLQRVLVLADALPTDVASAAMRLQRRRPEIVELSRQVDVWDAPFWDS